MLSKERSSCHQVQITNLTISSSVTFGQLAGPVSILPGLNPAILSLFLEQVLILTHHESLVFIQLTYIGALGLICAYSAILRGASKVYSIDRVPARLEKARSIGAIPIDFSKGDPAAQIMEFEPLGVDRACDCVGFECLDINGKNKPNEVITNAINVVKPAGGIGVIGAYQSEDPRKLTCALISAI